MENGITATLTPAQRASLVMAANLGVERLIEAAERHAADDPDLSARLMRYVTEMRGGVAALFGIDAA